jgi:hypothetical protein
MIGKLDAIVLDTPDTLGLATFHATLAGLDLRREDSDGSWVSLSLPSGQQLAFQQAADHVPPQWPDPAHPQQFHLDVEVPDLDEAEQQALKLGATRLPGGGEGFRVFADPVGHPFCLVR